MNRNVVVNARCLARLATRSVSLFFALSLIIIVNCACGVASLRRQRTLVICTLLLVLLCAHVATADEAPETSWRLGERTPLSIDVRLSTELRKPDIPCDPDEIEGDVVVSTTRGHLTVEATLASTRKVQVGAVSETMYVVAVRHRLTESVSAGVELNVNAADGERTLLPGLYVRLGPRARLTLAIEVPLGAAPAPAKTVRAQLNWAF